ncbi:MAG TPA: hypothetical protein VGM39_21735 [Kofleriaceae bacterium]|jgi:hypothetical protein
MLIWRLLPPATKGNETEVATIDERVRTLLAEFDDADEDREAEIETELEALKTKRLSLAAPAATLDAIAGDNPAARPPHEAPAKLGPYALHVVFIDAIALVSAPALHDEVFVNHSPAHMQELIVRLQAVIEDLDTQDADGANEDVQRVKALILRTAAWLDFWSKAGVGFDVVVEPDDE